MGYPLYDFQPYVAGVVEESVVEVAVGATGMIEGVDDAVTTGGMTVTRRETGALTFPAASVAVYVSV